MDWMRYKDGQTLGQLGAGGGTIIDDLELPDAARLTLEEDSDKGPFAISCQIYGWMSHVRVAKNAQVAQNTFADMQHDLTKLFQRIPRMNDPHRMKMFEESLMAVGEFVERYS